MTDVFDRAAAREAELLQDALQAQQRRAGLAGKTAADSAEFCEAPRCGEPIPQARREAMPGCQFCVACQTRLEQGRKK